MAIADLIDNDDCAWLDWRWCWLAERLGYARIRNAEVLGGIDAFIRTNMPITEDTMQLLAEEIAKQLGITDCKVQIVAGPMETAEDAETLDMRCELAREVAGTIVVGLGLDQLADPQVTAFFAMKHIIYEYLFLKGWLDEGDADALEVAELAAVQLGVGVILANNYYVSENVTYGTMEWGRAFHGTELGQDLITYALARLAHLCGETSATWQKKLRPETHKRLKHCLDTFETEPPIESTTKPEGVMSPAEYHAKRIEEEAEDWTEDEILPANPDDRREDTSATVYCKACAYDVTGLPEGDCPGCGKAFDPEDLRTISLLKPTVVSEAAHRRLALLRKVVLWSVIGLAVTVVVMILLTCMGIAPGPKR